MTARIKADVENHLAQGHTVLNGMIHEQPDASAVLRAGPYAALLMDVNMPVMDGLEASRLILAAHATSDTAA